MESTVNILQQSCIKTLIKEEKFPHDLIGSFFNDLSSEDEENARSAMPLNFLYEVDCGGDHNKIRMQNLLAYITGHFLMRVDKTCIYRGCTGHSYLNVAERGMSICNLALAKHGVCIDSNATKWLFNVLHSCRSMKSAREAIEQCDIELERAKEFRKEHPLLANHSDDDSSVDESMMEEEDDDYGALDDVEVDEDGPDTN